VNLGVAVDTPDGLVVPVVHDAHLMTPAELSTRVSQLAERARAKKLAPAELEGATFTVSNLGAFGVENGTPVIFAPQAALMFAGAVRDEVLAIYGRAEVRPAMQIAIAYDHRGIDGALASRFTIKVKQLL
jgi:pyruvate dehydrogenase E2 component (dihydrolipoamide acetyltransferase)